MRFGFNRGLLPQQVAVLSIETEEHKLERRQVARAVFPRVTTARVDGGYHEVVLTGVHLGHYGVDWNRSLPRDRWMRLPDLVRAIPGRPPR